MITDEQRREVAKELRKLTTPGCIRYAEEFYEELREIVTFDLDGSFEGAADSLADLIDRPTCHLVEDEDGRTACSECGCTALYLLDATYCPDCGSIIERPR